MSHKFEPIIVMDNGNSNINSLYTREQKKRRFNFYMMVGIIIFMNFLGIGSCIYMATDGYWGFYFIMPLVILHIIGVYLKEKTVCLIFFLSQVAVLITMFVIFFITFAQDTGLNYKWALVYMLATPWMITSVLSALIWKIVAAMRKVKPLNSVALNSQKNQDSIVFPEYEPPTLNHQLNKEN
eukprot:TRINITY_DN10163_c0_g1_i1.p1 TRINITY_DN10163_c0_g1~~TRINITY_DN10163_c0_g1_i1.p1  ORF type:complete len:182 (-),score=20.53 TRINITY_DN10163_c0_g1_i1:22-567(-)